MADPRLPRIIQGGMGIGVSSRQLAKAVSMRGELGVVSGTALDAVLARRLQDGDPSGDLRRAMASFPSQAMAERVLHKYFIEGGRPADQPYRPHPKLNIHPSHLAIELSLVANFVEVWLAKEGHDGVVGINLLEKVQVANASAVLGAMLADVDYILMGAGVPREIPRLIRDFAAGRPGSLTIDVVSETKPQKQTIDPREYLCDDLPELKRPKFLAIISQHVLANYLNRDETIRPDGFVVEGPVAGGHSAPPRGKMNLDADGQPIYTDKDDADIAKIAQVGLPFWLAGAYGTPERVAEALSAGAAGVQVGTLFAMSEESGLLPHLRQQLLDGVRDGSLHVRNDPRASPTGFPFKVASLEGSLSEQEVYVKRERICDMGYLREAVERPDGSIVYRCASEPVHMYTKKGGEEEATVGRKCLCNALLANIGLPQIRKDGYVEETLVTLSQNLEGPQELMKVHPDGWTAAQAVDWLLSAVPA